MLGQSSQCSLRLLRNTIRNLIKKKNFAKVAGGSRVFSRTLSTVDGVRISRLKCKYNFLQILAALKLDVLSVLYNNP